MSNYTPSFSVIPTDEGYTVQEQSGFTLSGVPSEDLAQAAIAVLLPLDVDWRDRVFIGDALLIDSALEDLRGDAV